MPICSMSWNTRSSVPISASTPRRRFWTASANAPTAYTLGRLEPGARPDPRTSARNSSSRGAAHGAGCRTARRRDGRRREWGGEDHHHRESWRIATARKGRSVLLCAADTFRAAAIDQLEIWGQRTGTEVIRQQPGSDPSAVFSTLSKPRKRARWTTSSSIPRAAFKQKRT